MAPVARPRAGAGFTLLELLIVLAVLTVAALLAAPAYSTLVERQKIRSEVTRLQLAFFQARSEAIKRNRRVVLCPLRERSPPRCGGLIENGWMLFVDRDLDRRRGTDEPVIRLFPASDGLSISNRRGTRGADETISFRPDGSARRALTLMVCSRARPDLPSRSLVVNRIGRPRVAEGWGSCPATPER